MAPDIKPSNVGSQPRIRVLIADDHAILREGLRGLLEEQPDLEVVGEATTGAQAVAKVRELNPDILILDLIMPEMDGVQVLQQLAKLDLGTKVVVLTGADDEELLARSVQAGAAGYLLKDSASSQLIDAIRAVAGGNCWLPPGLTGRLFHGIVMQGQVDESAKLSILTARELEVLKLLGEAQSNSQIADKLFISEHTVKVHVSRILEKLDIASRTEAVKFAIRIGLVNA